jgi:hypothetical protein
VLIISPDAAAAILALRAAHEDSDRDLPLLKEENHINPISLITSITIAMSFIASTLFDFAICLGVGFMFKRAVAPAPPVMHAPS